MLVRRFLLGILIGWAYASAVAAADPSPPSAATSFALGQTLLAQDDLEGALDAFSTAARADAGNPIYRQQVAAVGHAIALRTHLDAEQDDAQWRCQARALRAFYYSQILYRQALALDQRVYRRLRTDESATWLAETQLALGMNAQAIALLETLGNKHAKTRGEVLRGIALARLGKTCEAEAIAHRPTLPDDWGPRLLLASAQLSALVGEQGEALRLLALCFELTPPQQLDPLKESIKSCEDFGPLTTTTEFTEVLKTESKVRQANYRGCDTRRNTPNRGT
ncbi:MAG: hypothetical protein ACYC35_02165 [Pirellulales bacterium]